MRTISLSLFLLLAVTGVAHADGRMHTFRIEGGVAIPVTRPQASLFDAGGGGSIGYELLPVPWIGIEARVSAFWMPSSAANPSTEDFGTYYAPALALRLHPLAGAGFGAGDLWLGVGGAMVFTGDVLRPGLEVGLGYEFDLAWWLHVGPFIRYHHVFQTVPGTDAGFVTIGLSIALGGEEPPPSDRDGDRIIDTDDACPDEPEDFDEWQDADGCPDTDNDVDGIPDTRDGCPNDPEDRDGWQDDDGCAESDNDADGILDAADTCPNDAEDRDGWQDEDGCPDGDNDGDGILDAADGCPNEAETRNGHQDEDGCPDVLPPPPRTETEIQLDELGERIQFAQGRVQVLPASRSALRAVIRLLRQHPEITRITVEAHASSEGTTESNMELSQRRAQTVVDLLVRGGIQASRVTAQSFGEGQPDVAGTTEDELAANRRVSFRIETSVQVPATP